MLLFGRGTCGAAWNSLFVLRKLLSSHHDVITPRKVTLIGIGFRVAGTCGAAWNSSFVPRKLSSSHHDFLIPWKSYIVEPIGWWHLAACGSTFPSVDETFPCRLMSHPKLGTVAKLL